MLIEFAVQNFKSFKDLQVFSMEATKEKDDANPQYNQVYEEGKIRLLKTKAIYGANGSGKSNLVYAVNSFWSIVKDNLISDKILRTNYTPNRLSQSGIINEETFFQIILLIDGVRYRYGFEYIGNEVKREWLFRKKSKEIMLFERNDKQKITINESSFKEGKILTEGFVNLFKNNTLVVSVLHALNQKVSSGLVDCINGGLFTDLRENVKGRHKFNIQPLFEKYSDYKEWLLQYLKSVDPTITDIQLKTRGAEQKYFVTIRKSITANDVPFFMEYEEAEGTKKALELSIFLYSAMTDNFTLFIDELDAKLHPKLSRQIIEFFQSDKVHPKSQLIFVSHDTNLLDAGLLRRDQITFVEKSKEGHSEIYDLSDIKGVRAKDLFEKNYLKGNYGAIPTLTNFGEIPNVDA